MDGTAAGVRHLSPDDEIMPGVKWGLSSWIGSPAFWYALAKESSDDDIYASPPGTNLREVVVFCLLGGYGIKAELNIAAFEKVMRETKIAEGAVPPTSELERILRVPLAVGGKFVKYRFPKQKADRIASALMSMADLPAENMHARELRDHLMTIRGIGPKTASWVVRNWLGSDEVAILDVHIMRAGQFIGLFPHASKLPRDYPSLEDKFLTFAKVLDIRASLLDSIIWREARELPSRYLCTTR